MRGFCGQCFRAYLVVMKKFLFFGLVCLTTLTGCKDNEKTDLQQQVQTLQQQVQTLQRENQALTAERDALKAQLGVAATTAAAAVTANQNNAVHQSARDYVNDCARALAMMQVDAADLELPKELSGKSCDDPALGSNAVKKPFGVSTSIITLTGGSSYTISVTDTTGQSFNYNNP